MGLKVKGSRTMILFSMKDEGCRILCRCCCDGVYW